MHPDFRAAILLSFLAQLFSLSFSFLSDFFPLENFDQCRVSGKAKSSRSKLSTDIIIIIFIYFLILINNSNNNIHVDSVYNFF